MGSPGALGGFPRSLAEKAGAAANEVTSWLLTAAGAVHSWATSWGAASVRRVTKLKGVVAVSFDMCQYGLASRLHGCPHRKRTTILTNSKVLADELRKAQCGKASPCYKRHSRIKGCEGGMTRARHAQTYPQAFCAAIVTALEIELANRS